MIELEGLTKRYGDKTAVDHLTFTVRPGVVTGFLGPNGAGKSTTMRMMLGLDNPTSGDGADRRQALPTAAATRCKTSARCWTPRRCTAAAAPTTTCCAWRRRNGIPRAPGGRGAGDGRAARRWRRKQSKGFSLGMGQRLGIAGGAARRPARS